MGKVLAASLICAAILAGWPVAADEEPRLTNAGLYDVTYDMDSSGDLRVKTIRLTQATDQIVARPGVAFGVCCQRLLIGGQPPQAGYLHPEAAGAAARFWGVETGFSREASGPQRFYGFVFEKGSRPAPGVYGVNLYRADDGSLLAQQLFRVVNQPQARDNSQRGSD